MKCILFLLVVSVVVTTLANSSRPQRKWHGIPPEVERPFDQITPSTIPYRFPREQRGLDDGWGFRDTLYDASPNNPELFNAYPVAMALTHEGRGYVATLHTVFATQDYGRTWRNLDQNPPPNGSDFIAFRIPNYISTLAPRTVHRDSARYDSFYVVTQHASFDSSTVRLLNFNTNSWFLYPFASFRDNQWLTHMAIPDSHTAALLSGAGGRIVRTDTLIRNAAWYDLDYNFFGGYLAGRMDIIDSTLIAVGSSQWVSRDQGRTWSAQPPADPIGDYSVDFCNDSIGWTGGGRISPSLQGWARKTVDGGATWSERLHTTTYPIRSVACISDSIAFIAGGDYESAVGGIWSTIDGGATWTEVLTVPAEIRCLEHVRVSPAYVDVVAAGVFPDLRGGIWSTRIFLPDTVGRAPVLYFDPDTLTFGAVEIGDRDTLATWIYNIGDFPGQLLAFNTRGGPFNVDEQHIGTQIQSGDSLEIRIVFRPEDAGDVVQSCDQENVAGQLLELHCFGTSPLAADYTPPSLPTEPSLLVSPNPGNADFQLRFVIERATDISLTVFDLQGRVVAEILTEHLQAGSHVKTWSAANFASGLYFVRLNSSDFSITRKILLLK